MREAADWLAPTTSLIQRHVAQEYPVVREFGGTSVQVEDGVFDPGLTNVSRLVLDSVDFTGGGVVLDAFSGSGLFGLHAAQTGARRVVSVDISAAAVACIRRNADRIGHARTIEVRHGRVHEVVGTSEAFDVLVANPPLLPHRPINELEAAVFDPGFASTQAYVRAMRQWMSATSRSYIVQSSLAVERGFDVAAIARAANLTTATASEATMHGETYRVLMLTVPKS